MQKAPLAARVDDALRQGTAYLLRHQAQDGAWYSETYGAFKDGWSLTPVVLLALVFVPEDPAISPAWARGADFLASAVTTDGQVRPAPAPFSYPTETLALAAAVLTLPYTKPHRPARDAFVAELKRRQLTEINGFSREDPNDGGWGYGAGLPRRPANGLPPDDPRNANLAATLLAVGTLHFTGTPPTDPAMQAARRFVLRCQNPDGGFFFGPTGDSTNKAGRDAGGRPRSYGSMTADGFRALRHLATEPSDGDRLKKAQAWLHRHFDPERAAGDYAPDRALQRDAVYYYQTWSMAHALMTGSPPELETARGQVNWAEAMAEALLRRQRPDGSFRNPATDLREDDPLLATPLAMAALGIVRFRLSGRLEASMPVSSALP